MMTGIAKLKQREWELGERQKELQCLHDISALQNLPGISFFAQMEGIVGLIPLASQFPEITAARITLEKETYQTKNFRKTPWIQTCEIVVNDRPAGRLEVCYLEKRPTSDEGPFLTQERNLLNTIVERIGCLCARKQVEEALRKSEERYALMERAVNDALWERDLSSNAFHYSPRWKSLLGYEEDELPRNCTAFLDLIHPDDQATVRKAQKSHLEELTPYVVEFRMRHKDGTYRWLLSRGAAVRDTDGRPARSLGAITDITARRASEKILRLHGAALAAAANAIVITDRQGTIEWVNPAFSMLSGWSFAEAVGKNPRELVKSGEQDAAFYRQMWETLLAGKVWQGEIINRRKDGERRTEDMTITPLRNPQGEIMDFVAIKVDTTAHKTLEAHFMQAQRMESIGALAGGIAHDLNNILTPILLVTSLVKDKLPDKSDQELLEMAESTARRGVAIIKQLLTFSRGQQGERTVVQPGHQMTEMMTMMRETFPREIDLQLQLPADLWPVIADPSQLHQVLMNLCVNARDAMPTGGRLTLGAANVTMAEVDTKLMLRAKPGPYIVFKVSDAGHGIPPEIKHRIFDPFFTTKPLGKGTGLGLSTLLSIVYSHGGFVAVDSVPNMGSTFSIYFPAIPGLVAAVAEVPVVPATQRAAGQTILVVDDEQSIREMTRVLLESQNYRVMTAVSGQDALVQYLEHRSEISLVLTDLMMPVMSGIDLIRALHVINPTLKIIAMSGLTEMVEERNLAALGALDLLMKPCDGPTLLETVHHRLSNVKGVVTAQLEIDRIVSGD